MLPSLFLIYFFSSVLRKSHKFQTTSSELGQVRELLVFLVNLDPDSVLTTSMCFNLTLLKSSMFSVPLLARSFSLNRSILVSVGLCSYPASLYQSAEP